MKYKILVLNGQRLVERFEDNKWKTVRSYKAGSLKGGIYNIFMAKDGNINEVIEGILVHSTKEEIFLRCNFGFVRYDIPQKFKLPEIGSAVTVMFDHDEIKLQKIELKRQLKHTI